MEKNILRLLKTLKVEIALAFFIVIVAFVLGELNVIENGMIEPKSKMEFRLNVSVIVVACVCVPLALKLFTLNTTKGLRRMNMDEALQAYHNRSLARIGLLLIAALFDIVVYYLTMNTTGLMFALGTMAVLCYCWPARKNIDGYLESLKREN